MKIEFKEEQKFPQWWLWLILIGVIPYVIIGVYRQFTTTGEFEYTAIFNTSFIITSLLIIISIILFRFMLLKTEINQNEILVVFFPFIKKRVNWKEVKHAKILKYGFVGGWGIRLWTKYGTVYNTKGNTGLAIELQNGKKFLIGTQKEIELNKILEKANLIREKN